jgi:hypothetical protein
MILKKQREEDRPSADRRQTGPGLLSHLIEMKRLISWTYPCTRANLVVVLDLKQARLYLEVNLQELLLRILNILIVNDKYKRTSPMFFFVLFQIVVFVSGGTLRLGVKMSSRLRYANGCPECHFM